MPSIHFRDSIGSALITTPAYTFANWTPDAEDIGDRATGLGTGTEYLFGFRVDYTVHLEMSHVPPLALADLMRLKRHLLNGGLITVFTDDAASRVYTCSLKPGSTPSWTLADRTNLEYTLTLELRHVAPVPMLADYSAVLGTTTNLIVNGGGETGTEGVQATSWTKDLGVDLVPTSGAFYRGARSLTHAHTVATSSDSLQQRAFTTGQRYLLSGWFKLSAFAAGTSGGNAYGGYLTMFSVHKPNFTVLWRSGDPRTPSDLALVSVGLAANGSARDWRYAAVLFDCLTGVTTSIATFAQSGGAAQAWFDDIRCEPVPAA